MSKSASRAPRYHALHELLCEAYKEANKPGAGPAAVEKVKGMISILNAVQIDGVVSLDFSRNFHNTIAEIIGPNLRQSEIMSRDQKLLDYGMQHLHKNFGGSAD